MIGPLPVYQSLWAMEDLPVGGTPWTLTEQLDRLEETGFAGVAVDLGARRRPTLPQLVRVLEGRPLRRAVFAFLATDDDLAEALAWSRAIDAERMVVCARLFSGDLVTSARVINHWWRTAADSGVRLELETHRYTVTNEIHRTADLLDHLDGGVRLAIDLSHHVCGCELPDQPDDEVESLIDALTARAGSAQGRIASRCQVQVPLGYPAHAHWEQRFRGWWRDAFSAMVADPDGAPMFCTELGPRPYAWVGADGAEVSDRWQEACTLKSWAEEAWAAANGRSFTPLH